MPRVPGQLWINLFNDGEAGTHCRTVHGRQDAAAEEIADWRQGLAWQGYAAAAMGREQIVIPARCGR